MSKEKIKSRWLFFGKDKYTYDTIDELVNKSMGLAPGEVVTLNGYYSADDGATHKRVIADTDDGSGVELRSGKWANIISVNRIKSSWLGFRNGDDIFNLITKCKNKDVEIECDLVSTKTIELNSKIYFNNHKLTVNSNVIVFKLLKNSYIENVNFYINVKNYSETLIYADENINTGFTKENKTYIDGVFVEDYKNENGYGYWTGSVLTLECQQKIKGKAIAIVGQSFKNFKAKYLQYGIHLKVRALENWGAFINSNFFTNLDFVCKTNIFIDGGELWDKSAEISSNEFKEINFQGNNTGKYIEMRSAHGNLFEGVLWDNSYYTDYNREGINILATENHMWCSRNNFNLMGVTRKLFKVNGIFGAWHSGLGSYNTLAEDTNRASFNRKLVSIPNIQNSFNVFLGHMDNVLVKAQKHFNVIAKTYTGDLEEVIELPEQIFSSQSNSSKYININDKLIIEISDPYLLITAGICGIIFDRQECNVRLDVIYGTSGVETYIGEMKDIFCTFNIPEKKHLTKLKFTITPVSEKNILINSIFASDFGKHSEAVFWTDRNFISYSDRTFMNTGKTLIQDNTTGELLLFRIDNKQIQIYDYNKSIEEQVVFNKVKQVNTPYHAEKMKQEGVYEDFIMYMDDKVAYDKEQKELEEQRQLEYQKALEVNPDLTYEEFMSVQPMTLNLVEEPRPTSALQKFMDKYL